MPILIEFLKSDPLYELKCSYYRRDITSFSRRLRVAVGECDNCKLMFALLRVIVADQEDLELLLSSVGPTTYRSIRDAQIAISPSNEFRMLQQLIRVCDTHLTAYPTTYEQDIERLKNGHVPQFSNERNALIQVKGEKEVLLYYRDFAITALKLISAKTTEEFDEALNYVRTNKHTSIFQYCRNTAARLFQENIRRGALRSKKQYDLTQPTVV